MKRLQSKIVLSDGREYRPVAVFEPVPTDETYKGKRLVRLIAQVVSRFRVPDQGPWKHQFPSDCLFHTDKGERVLVLCEKIEEKE